jgi:hypothetical protein
LVRKEFEKVEDPGCLGNHANSDAKWRKLALKERAALGVNFDYMPWSTKVGLRGVTDNERYYQAIEIAWIQCMKGAMQDSEIHQSERQPLDPTGKWLDLNGSIGRTRISRLGCHTTGASPQTIQVIVIVRSGQGAYVLWC